jgi:hypothetical protein
MNSDENPEVARDVDQALEHLREAEHDLESSRAKEALAEREVSEAIQELREAECPHPVSVEIFVNGKSRAFEGRIISYEEVVHLAFPGVPLDVIYTVAYANPNGQDGTLAPGQSTNVHKGMEFRVRKTNRS